MIEVRNLTFQPLTLHLKGGAGSLHLGPRARRLVSPKALSPEMQKAAKRGLLRLTEKAETPPKPGSETQAKTKGKQ